MKRSRQQRYKRNWAAATRRKKTHRDSSDESDKKYMHKSPRHIDFMPSVEEASVADLEHEVAACSDSFGPPHADQDVSDDGWKFIDQDVHVIVSSSESDGETEDFQEKLAAWAMEFNVKHNAVDSLLKLLKTSGHADLPVTARTLLHTTRNVRTEWKSGMQYYYFGLASELLKHFKMYPVHKRAQVDVLEISLNIDGLPLFRSSSMSLWPVLCAIVNIKPVAVFPIALTCGESKPTDLDFLSDLARDLKSILQHGLCGGDDEKIQVALRCIVCDAPARAMVKMVKLYSGYYGCDKCSQRGQWHQRITYQEVENLDLRTDLSFRRQENEGHHNGYSPLCELPIDMVKAFPIDYMHQVCLGCMKRLLLAWIRGIGKAKVGVKHSAEQINQISRRLEGMKRFMPSAFSRKPRSLTEVDRWKATEFRQFLLYTGKIVLRGALNQDLYEHFLTLSVALSILVCPKIAQTHTEFARQLLLRFVTQGRKLYGEHFLVYNVHSLLHLADEVKEYGSLDACSAFPFENYMQQLKKLVRCGKKPMTQIVKRLSERTTQLESQLQKHVKISTESPNNAFVLEDTSCCEVIRTINVPDQEVSFMCRVYERAEPLFMEPCDSRIIGVYRVHTKNAHMRAVPAECLTWRAIRLEQTERSTCIFLGLLHELE